MAKRRQVIHKPDPQTPDNEMPKTAHVFRRGGVFYLRRRVPTDLVAHMKTSEIRVSLGTTDFTEAHRKADYARAKLALRFDEARQAMNSQKRPAQPRSLSDEEMHRIVWAWFIKEERKAEETRIQWGQSEQWELETAWDDLCEVLQFYRREQPRGEGDTFFNPASPPLKAAIPPPGLRPADWKQEKEQPSPISLVEELLSSAGIELPKDNPAIAKLGALLRRGMVELTQRQLQRLRELGGFRIPEAKDDPLFREVFAHSSPPVPAKPAATVADMIAAFLAFHRKESRASTVEKFALPLRLLSENFGEATPLSSITPASMGEFFDLLQKLPPNAAKRYTGKTMREAITAAEASGDTSRISRQTMANHFHNIKSCFHYAVEMKLTTENPAFARPFRKSYGDKSTASKPKEQFTVEELNKLFRAPLYTGCEDDERGHTKPGDTHPRRGKFWLPLLGLFHGLRLNEVCQLHISDIIEEHGIPTLWVTDDDTDDGSASPEPRKAVKTQKSRRKIPIHPEVLKIGFLEFVRQRKAAGDSPRLFPELPYYEKKANYSHHASKWFRRFVTHAVGPQCKAGFHSLRHGFRDAAELSRMPSGMIERLAGWASGPEKAETMADHYGKGPVFYKVLAEELAKIKYEGLDLRHLYQFPKRPRKA